MFADIELLPKKTVRVSPKKFLQMSEEERTKIARCRFIPPKLGGKGFGKVELTYRHPIYSRR